MELYELKRLWDNKWKNLVAGSSLEDFGTLRKEKLPYRIMGMYRIY
jgi:hypothetical protein